MNKWVKWWLFSGLVMLLIQFLLGSITRLTESGLSITKWEIVSGTLPPLTEDAWVAEFELYKETPQYKEINEGMTFSDFKFIYFWEYFHRLWARIMGFVFLFPFLYFLFKKLINTYLLKRLGLVVLMSMLAASFGWIMVASGLIERPWVNAYKLSLHLCIAFTVYAALFWTYLEYKNSKNVKLFSVGNISTFLFLIFLWLQLFFGGVMSGMKAGVYHATWPTISGEYFPHLIFNIKEWTVDNFNNYDKTFFLPTLIQFLHRMTAYSLFLLGIYIFYDLIKRGYYHKLKQEAVLFISMLILQVILGIITVLMCKGEVPIVWGVLHQLGALLLLSATMMLRYKIKITTN